MQHSIKLIINVLALIFSVTVIAQSNLPNLNSLDSGWNTLATDGVCSAGTPYQFYAKPSADNSEVLVFFNGGGACWFGQACDLNAQPNVHTPFADMDANNPAMARGIFDFESSENPFANYSMVVVPYCNGDVHIGGGAREYTYENETGEEVSVTAYHNGFANSQTALDWVYANFSAPDRIVVSGSSAGAIGGSFYAGLIAEHYAATPVVLIADAAGGYGTPNLYRTLEAWDVASILPDWPEYAGKTNRTLTFEDFYIASANHNDNLIIAQYNTAEDQVQYNFTYLIGDPQGSFTLPQRLLNNYLIIENSVDQFSHYTAGGATHTIMGAPIFYEYEVEDVRFVDWVSDLINGMPVDDISCVNETNGCAGAPD
ncbi:MAG: pectin acetylesterase-family hydrolase [Gammaproteobacteria bacterium]|nr:pectin acetylesterase-family hydrolase [Gammaproteobacteria bacterium]MDD9894783.1 pectin acetylesterase-family hydrolase [Gammaproteobacteria bacterium]MDD9958268.1 pectin acetylesterase-family hydrolase [Gammaproteobacteria bacterium]